MMSSSDGSSPSGSDHGRMNEPVGRNTVSTVFPRRKPNALRANNLASAPVSITLEILEQLASLSLPIAASKLGISATAMKNACRKLGISRWPYLPARCTRRDATLADHAGDVKREPAVYTERNTQPKPVPEMVCAETQTDLTFAFSHLPNQGEMIPGPPPCPTRALSVSHPALANTSVDTGSSSDVFSTTLALPRSRASSITSEVSAAFASYGYCGPITDERISSSASIYEPMQADRQRCIASTASIFESLQRHERISSTSFIYDQMPVFQLEDFAYAQHLGGGVAAG
jgi:hypothetical protein